MGGIDAVVPTPMTMPFRAWYVVPSTSTVSGAVNVALPRVRDFRGLNPKSFDGRGNYSLGIKEHIIFPEIDFDKMGETWGMDVTVCTTARTDDEARALLSAFNFPFRQ